MQQADELHEALQSPFGDEDEMILEVMKKAMIDADVDVQLRREGMEGRSKTIWD